MHIYLAKSSWFESTDFASVMFDDVGCSRRHQCPQCGLSNPTPSLSFVDSLWPREAIWLYINPFITDPGNGLSPVLSKAIASTNADLLSIGPLETFFCITVIKVKAFSFKKMHLNMSPEKCCPFCSGLNILTQWGWVTHLCVSKPTIIGSNNGSAPGRHQAIIWTNAGILLIWTLGTNFSEILSKKVENFVCKMLAILSRSQCVKLIMNLIYCIHTYLHIHSVVPS